MDKKTNSKDVPPKIGDILNSSVTGVNVDGSDNTISHTGDNQQSTNEEDIRFREEYTSHKDKNIQSEIDNLTTEINGNRVYLEKTLRLFIWLTIISLLLSVISFCFQFISHNVIIESDSIVVAFIGILASFIVISNFSQVSKIQSEIEGKVLSMEQKLIRRIEDTMHKVSIPTQNIFTQYEANILIPSLKNIISSMQFIFNSLYQHKDSSISDDYIERLKNANSGLKIQIDTLKQYTEQYMVKLEASIIFNIYKVIWNSELFNEQIRQCHNVSFADIVGSVSSTTLEARTFSDEAIMLMEQLVYKNNKIVIDLKQ